MDLEETMEEAWAFLRKQAPFFPVNGCKYAAYELYQRGFPPVFGYIHLDYYQKSSTIRIPHFWNYEISSGKRIDLTAAQFNGHARNMTFPKIFIWSSPLISIYEEIIGLNEDQISKILKPYEIKRASLS